MDNSIRAKLAQILEQLKQVIKQHQAQGELLDKTYSDLLTILSKEQ